jgi:cytidylate kinase
MMHSSRGHKSGIGPLLERQMRNWEMTRQQEGKGQKTILSQEIKFYITISRECGCGAEDIADIITEKTGFQKYDREILDFMVTQDDVRRKLYETLDDQTVSWIENICSSLCFGPSVDEEEYFNRLSHAVLAVCHNTHAIIIGRGANFVLPRQLGLAVRLVAPLNYRLDLYAKRMNLDPKEAKTEIIHIEKRRSQFIENHFGKFAYDPRRYDLVINVAQFKRESVADLIIESAKLKSDGLLSLPRQETVK